MYSQWPILVASKCDLTRLKYTFELNLHVLLFCKLFSHFETVRNRLFLEVFSFWLCKSGQHDQNSIFCKLAIF
ncbi:hypothetical protein FKM82_006500 [Ascaphus truei]